jgi:hypothetical protein
MLVMHFSWREVEEKLTMLTKHEQMCAIPDWPRTPPCFRISITSIGSFDRGTCEILPVNAF